MLDLAGSIQSKHSKSSFESPIDKTLKFVYITFWSSCAYIDLDGKYA
jgi:hypothetical protein